MWQRAPEPFQRALYRLSKALANGSSPPSAFNHALMVFLHKKSKAPLAVPPPPTQSPTPVPYRFLTPTPKRLQPLVSN